VLAQKLKAMLRGCIGFEGDELQATRKLALDYYFQRPRGDEIAGRSSHVTGDLSSMVEGNLAQMMEPLTGKRIAEFCAYDPADEEQAQLETDTVSEMLFKRQNGFIEIVSAIKDAMLARNAVIKVYVDERTHTKTVNKTGVTSEIVTDVLDKIGDVEIHQFNPRTGKLSATVRKTTRRFRVECTAPENFLVPKSWHRQDLDGCPVHSERHVEARSCLIERGFPPEKVEKLKRFNSPNYANGSADRLPRNVSPWNFPLDTSQEDIEWYEMYCLMDDGTGAAELRRICFSDTYILDDEPYDFVQYATGCLIINPHTWIGISLFDKLKTVQDGSTAMTRALFDNLNAVNKNRTAHLDGVAEESDLTDGRVNGSIRVNPNMCQDVRQAVTAFQVPSMAGDILQNLQYMKQNRAELGGAAVDMASGMMQLNDRVGSQGLDRAYSAREAFADFMTRTVAYTLIRSMYLIAHETLRTQWKDPIQFKRGKEWVKVMPATWPVRDAIHMNLGASQGERARQSAVLDKAMDRMALLAEHGMEDILVDAEVFYNTFIDWLRANDVAVPERHILDPRSDRAVQAFKSKAIQAKQSKDKQDALMQTALMLEQVRTALDKYKADQETQFNYYKEVLNAQIEEAKITADTLVSLTQAKQTAKAAAAKGAPDESTTAKATGKSTAKQPVAK
jgi:hypothetical protein